MTRREALEILGLDSDASLDEARNAYRKLARIYHPDKNSAPNATAMFRIIHDAYEFILNNDVYQQTEATTRQKQAEAEAARKRAEEESARRHAEAEAQRKYAEETHRRAQEEAAQKAKKKAERKNIRNFCIALFPINLVLTSLAMVDWSDGTIILRKGSDPLYLTFPFALIGFSINSLGFYYAFHYLAFHYIATNYPTEPTRSGTGRKKTYGKQFIALYATYAIVCTISMMTDQLSVVVVSLLFLGIPCVGLIPFILMAAIPTLIIIVIAKSLTEFVNSVRRRK